MSSKKARHDTAAGALSSFASAKAVIPPPAHTDLHKGAEPFYNAVINSRDKSQWNEVDLCRAVELSNYQLMIRENNAELKLEGAVVVNERGTPIKNPRFDVVNSLSRLQISLSKSLQTDAASTQGRSRDNAGKNTKAASAKKVIDSFEDDDLIPMATH